MNFTNLLNWAFRDIWRRYIVIWNFRFWNSKFKIPDFGGSKFRILAFEDSKLEKSTFRGSDFQILAFGIQIWVVTIVSTSCVLNFEKCLNAHYNCSNTLAFRKLSISKIRFWKLFFGVSAFGKLVFEKLVLGKLAFEITAAGFWLDTSRFRSFDSIEILVWWEKVINIGHLYPGPYARRSRGNTPLKRPKKKKNQEKKMGEGGEKSKVFITNRQ